MILDPVRSLIDFPFYREVPKKSILACSGYIAYLSLLFSLAVVLALYARVAPMIDAAAQWASSNVPAMTLQDGKIECSIPGPLRIEHPETKLAFIVDTARITPVTPAELADGKVIGYIAQSTLYFTNQGKMEVYDLSKAANKQPVRIDGEFYLKVAALIKKALYPIGFITTWLIFFVWKHLSALVYSLIGLALNAALSAGLEHADLYRVAVYAQTPVVVLQIVSLFLPRNIPFAFLLSTMLVTLYLWQAIRHLRPAAPAAEQT
ncbi:MAG: DUF1189 family protein [Elusimicrobiota bacterium]|jgi:hypothetical protein